jgi:RNA polymerase sigma factor (sigma-70 family)
MTTARTTPVEADDDGALARAAARGNQSAFAAIYDRYADRLYDFCVGMLRDRDAAADCVQDVFVTAATKLAQLREPDRLRSWLFAIARNEALSRIRERRREQPSEELPEMPSAEPDLVTLAGRRELAELISEACGGLSDRDRTVLELAYRQGLDGPELADALGVSHSNANNLVGRLRETIERSLGALLVSRRAKADPDRCPELAALLGQWDGQFTVLVRKRVARHIEGCAVCDGDRRRMVSPVALLGSMPVFVPAPSWLREHTLTHVSGIVARAAAAPAPAGAQTGSGDGVAGAGSAQGTNLSWWPPRDIDTTDLGDSGHAMPLGPPARLAGSQGADHVPHAGAGPPTPEPSPGTDNAHGHLPSHIRTALVATLVLLLLAGGFFLGRALVYQVRPAVAPGGPVMPTPTTSQAPAVKTPTSQNAPTAPPAPTTVPAPAGTSPTDQAAPTPLPASTATIVPTPAVTVPTSQAVPTRPPTPTPTPGPLATPSFTAAATPPANAPATNVPPSSSAPGGSSIPRRSAIGGSHTSTCPPNMACSPIK